MKVKEQHLWFLGFTAVFAALAGFVFWGTWSLDVAPVMPDDMIVHPMAYADCWAKSLLLLADMNLAVCTASTMVFNSASSRSRLPIKYLF